MDEYIQICTTTEKKSDASYIARSLLEGRLAGCIQIVGPIESAYLWKENIEIAEEWLCFIKTKKSLYEQIEKEIKKIHPYELPELIALSIIDGSKDYLEWLSSEIKEK